MPALENDLLLKLDPADHATLLAARIAERDATILAADHERRRTRSEQSKGANHADTKKAEANKKAKLDEAKTHEDAHAATVAAIKGKHAATDLTCADEGHDITRGAWLMKAGPLLSGLAAIEVKRLPLTDAQCDEYIANYRVSARVTFEAPDLQRQIDEYLEAHPPIDGEPGHLIPEPQALLDLRAALKAKQDEGSAAQEKIGAIYAAVMAAAGERDDDWTYKRISTEGDIVLGHNPDMTKNDVVVLHPSDGETMKGRP